MLSLIVYRHWRETEATAVELDDNSKADLEIDDSTETLNCPKCKSLMTKYRFSSTVNNKIDFCANCEELWFDSGEWDLVDKIAKSGHLAEIFGQPWQRKIRRETTALMEQARLKELLGKDFEKFDSFRDWIESHPERSQLLAMLARKRTL